MPEHQENRPSVHSGRERRAWSAFMGPIRLYIRLSGPIDRLSALIQEILLRTDADLLLIPKPEKTIFQLKITGFFNDLA